MWGILDALKTPKQREMERAWKKREIDRRLPLCVPWDPQMKWAPEMNIKADTYKPIQLFEVETTDHSNVNYIDSTKERVLSKNKLWMYTHLRLRRGEKLAVYCGAQRGTVLFDGPVIVPRLNMRRVHTDRWEEVPFMSLTPMELMTLRGGTRRAKGHVVVAGLGLGHQLIEVSKRKQVTKLVLVEKSQDLVDFVLPKVREHLHRQLDDVIVGDAYEELPKLHADAALVDIFESYGNNDWEQEKLRKSCPNIDYIWCWGTAKMTGGLW